MGPVGDAIFPLNPLTFAPVPETLEYQTSQIRYNVTLLHVAPIAPVPVIEVTSVINLTQGARPRWKFVYT